MNEVVLASSILDEPSEFKTCNFFLYSFKQYVISSNQQCLNYICSGKSVYLFQLKGKQSWVILWLSSFLPVCLFLFFAKKSSPFLITFFYSLSHYILTSNISYLFNLTNFLIYFIFTGTKMCFITQIEMVKTQKCV